MVQPPGHGRQHRDIYGQGCLRPLRRKHLRAKGEKAAHDVKRRFDQYVLDNPVCEHRPFQTQACIYRGLAQPPARPRHKDGGVRTAVTLNRDMTSFGALNLAR